jgi:hypothetical protein
VHLERAATVVVMFLACHKPPPPEPSDPLVIGGPCHQAPPTCASKDVALVCVDGTWRRMPCTDACKELTPDMRENDTPPCTISPKVRAGDACTYPFMRGRPREGDKTGCSEDGREVLECRSPTKHDSAGVFASSKTCAPNERCVADRVGASCRAD